MQVFFILIITACSALPLQAAWIPDWSEEFDYEGAPDPDVWEYEIGYKRNNEQQYYTDDPRNVSVGGGLLTITALRDAAYERGYSSASLITSGKKHFRYGRWVLRARIDTRTGSWPAWWTVGVEGGAWPHNGEVDMMEFYRGMVLANWAYRKAGQNITWDSKTVNISEFDAGWSERFHTWEYIWREDSAFIYLDSLLLNSFDLEAAQEGDYNPFRSHDHFMWLNLAIGGNNGGDPAGTEFPMRYEVDFVRVYRWEDNPVSINTDRQTASCSRSALFITPMGGVRAGSFRPGSPIRIFSLNGALLYDSGIGHE